ncbi:MAG TPA: hypothetical protein VI958_13165, partial [Acidobacteriota bacterium]
MILLHGAYNQHRFHVWAESEAQEKRDGCWPYSLNHDQLLEALAKVGSRHATSSTITATFPASGDVALPSSPLFGESPPRQHATTLAEWKVAAVEMATDTTIQFLNIEEPRIEAGLFYGSDLLYWAQAMRFGHRLLLHQKFLPWTESTEARWIPLLLGNDQLLFDDLTRSMPEYCRAFGGHGGPPSRVILLHDFVSFFLD